MAEQQWNLPGVAGICAATGKRFSPGEAYWAVVVVENGTFVRREYAEAAWNDGLRQNAFSFWKSRMPKPEEPTRHRFVDDEVILEFFRKLEQAETADQKAFRYVLALLLVRKKVFKFADVERPDGREILVLKEVGADAVHRVETPDLTEEALLSVRNQVQQVLSMGEEEAVLGNPMPDALPDPGAPFGDAKVEVREEHFGDLTVRHRITHRKGLGGIGIAVAFVVVVLVTATVAVIPQIQAAASALFLVMLLFVFMKTLNVQYQREVERRIQNARESHRRQMALQVQSERAEKRGHRKK